MRLVSRARKAGWDVELATGGTFYKIYSPNKKVIQVYLSPSDTNHYANVLKQLMREGFDKAEADMVARNAKAKAESMAADAAENDRRTAAATKQAKALARAAGPYAAADVTLTHILSAHPAPITYHRVAITPDMAEAMLERNQDNRKLRRMDVDAHALEMSEGRWVYTHQGVAFDTNGRLQDGQHRLAAIVKSGVTVEMSVACGQDPDNFRVLDTGRRRTAAQAVEAAGLHSKGKLGSMAISAAARMIWVYDRYGVDALDHARDRLSNSTIVSVVDALDSECADLAGLFSGRMRASTGLPHSAGFSAAYILHRAYHPFFNGLDVFLAALAKGAGEDDEPAFVANRYIVRQGVGSTRKLTSIENVALIISAWNKTVAGERVHYMTIREGSRMPIPTPIGGKKR